MTTRQVLQLLRDYESRNVTFIEPAGSWPVVWHRARGAHVWDADGRKYLDLTAAFGVAAAGHANPRVVKAGQTQMARLLHAMGDVHPHELKARLARELSRITFERWPQSRAEGRGQTTEVGGRKAECRGPGAEHRGQRTEDRTAGAESGSTRAKTIFCNSGFEAVEAALKTAMLATGRRGVIVFEGAYHGLGYGALNATHREHFRGPFRSQLGQFGHFVPFPKALDSSNPGFRSARYRPKTTAPDLEKTEAHMRRILRREQIGAILVEPIQVRGGINLPRPGFLPLLRRLCDEHRVVLILDEIYTGFGRAGKWFACEHWGVVPDMVCLGKALTGGFPLSACVGRADLMDLAWPPSSGEAIHTSTFLGHPVGCAMALAQLAEIPRLQLVERSHAHGEFLLDLLQSRISSSTLGVATRGLGLLAGVEVNHADGSPATAESLRIVKALLRRGFILLPEGEHANVISFTPPLTITRAQLTRTVAALAEILATNETV